MFWHDRAGGYDMVWYTKCMLTIILNLCRGSGTGVKSVQLWYSFAAKSCTGLGENDTGGVVQGVLKPSKTPYF